MKDKLSAIPFIFFMFVAFIICAIMEPGYRLLMWIFKITPGIEILPEYAALKRKQRDIWD